MRISWSAPSLRLRHNNDSVPLYFPQNRMCMYVHISLYVCVWKWMWSGSVIFQAAKRKPTSTAIYHTLGIDLPSEGRKGMARQASPVFILPHPSSGLLQLTSCSLDEWMNEIFLFCVVLIRICLYASMEHGAGMLWHAGISTVILHTNQYIPIGCDAANCVSNI